MGTDYPFPWNTAPVDHILSIPGISDADKIAMLGGTAGSGAFTGARPGGSRSAISWTMSPTKMQRRSLPR